MRVVRQPLVQRDLVALVGEPTFRAWRIYLAGISGGFAGGSVQVNRLYCRAC